VSGRPGSWNAACDRLAEIIHLRLRPELRGVSRRELELLARYKAGERRETGELIDALRLVRLWAEAELEGEELATFTRHLRRCVRERILALDASRVISEVFGSGAAARALARGAGGQEDKQRESTAGESGQ